MEFNNIVVLTGAGISAESGIKTFRDNNGLWENHAIEDVATPEGFARNPELVYRFYNERRRQLQQPDIQPNAAHLALGKLAGEIGDRLLVVTQNVDNLHERGGVPDVLHMHGKLLSARCLHSRQSMVCNDDFDQFSRCRCCNPARGLRPDIVWFGEIPLGMEQIESALWQCDLFVAIGTSGTVYPAAGFVQLANVAGAHTVELNLQASSGQSQFSERHYGPASVIVPRFFDSIR